MWLFYHLHLLEAAFSPCQEGPQAVRPPVAQPVALRQLLEYNQRGQHLQEVELNLQLLLWELIQIKALALLKVTIKQIVAQL